jgi:hypothetical protein
MKYSSASLRSASFSPVRLSAVAALLLAALAVTPGCKKISEGLATNPGDACSSAGEARCVGTDATLLCWESKGAKKWVRNECRGPKGCKTEARGVDCDETVAQVNEFCDHEGNLACAPDKKSLVKCQGEKWVADDKCTGKEVCKVSGSSIGCE